MDTEAFEMYIRGKRSENIPLYVIAVSNNLVGGQPVSMQNIKEIKSLCKKNNILLFIYPCRFA